jgi:hypothetical protein
VDVDQSDASEAQEDRRKHLEFVQSVIARLSQSSANAKGWSLTLAGAAAGFSITQERASLAVISIVVLLAFSTIDCNYLQGERRFRDLYDAVRRGEVDTFDMNARTVASSHTWVRTYFSWSIAGFYGVLMVLGGLGAGIADRL